MLWFPGEKEPKVCKEQGSRAAPVKLPALVVWCACVGRWAGGQVGCQLPCTGCKGSRIDMGQGIAARGRGRGQGPEWAVEQRRAVLQ